MIARESKLCVSCGRSFNWRKKWAREWDNVKFCSEACRKDRAATNQTYQALESAILELLSRRDRGCTICPSEAARAVAPDDWQKLMEPARRAARRLVMAGKIAITQNGRVVDGATVRGPIRLRLV